MKRIATAIGWSAFALVVGGALLYVFARRYPPARPLTTIDTGANGWHVLGASEARQAVFGAPYLARTSTPKVIFIGASVVREGFRPDDWRDVTAFEPHNMAVGAATPGSLLRLWRHIDAAVRPAIARQSLVVLGVVYGMANDTWPDLVAAEEDHIALFYRLRADRWAGRRAVNVAAAATVPLFALEHAVNRAFSSLEPGIGAYVLGSAPPHPLELTPAEALAHWDELFHHAGHVPLAPMSQIGELVQRCRASGYRVAVVSMPLPSWHRAGSPYDREFSAGLRTSMADMTKSDVGIAFVDLHERFADDLFSDSMHPTRDGARQWSAALRHELSARHFLDATPEDKDLVRAR